MNPVISEALKCAAEKVLHRPLRPREESFLLEGFCAGEGTVCDRIIGSLMMATGLPRGLLERAAARSAGGAGIAQEVAIIRTAVPEAA